MTTNLRAVAGIVMTKGRRPKEPHGRDESVQFHSTADTWSMLVIETQGHILTKTYLGCSALHTIQISKMGITTEI